LCGRSAQNGVTMMAHGISDISRAGSATAI
jgi:hypothetical protein